MKYLGQAKLLNTENKFSRIKPVNLISRTQIVCLVRGQIVFLMETHEFVIVSESHQILHSMPFHLGYSYNKNDQAKLKEISKIKHENYVVESEVATLNRKVQQIEEDLEKSEERSGSATAKLLEATQSADENNR